MPKQLGQLEIFAELNEISGPAGPQRLEPQAVVVLELLAEQPGRVWPRSELLDRAWPGRVVSDATLTGVISRLRRALSAAEVADVRIETRSKRGYVLVLSEPAVTPRRSPLLPIAGLLLASFAIFVPWRSLFPPPLESLAGVRLDFAITFPDGMTSKPVLWLAPGRDGEIRLGGDQPLSLRVVPAIAGNGLLRLRLEAAGLSHWTGFEQVIGLGTESRFTLRAEEPGTAYDIRFTASRGDLPADLQEIPR